ncbi:MAG: flagellar hook-basal body complex protein FliE [Rhodoblastus sp.]
MIPLSMGLSVAQGIARSVADAARHPAAAGSGDFADVLANAATSAPRSIAEAENAASAGLHGKAPAREVVERLMYAEQNLQVLLVVRDKAVAALQEISRMAI